MERLAFFLQRRLLPWTRVYLFRLINFFIPKDKNLWVFHSKPVGYRDNSRAFYEYLVENAPEIKAVWLVDGRNEVDALKKRNVPVHYWRSIRGLWSLFRAGTLFTTHFGFVRLKVKRQRLVNLWHGMPIKAVGFTQVTEVNRRIHMQYVRAARRVDRWIATSPLTSLIISSSFGPKTANIGITGQPRTDLLFRDPLSARRSLHSRVGIAPDDRLAIWTPTFRKPHSGLRDDGADLRSLFQDTFFPERLNRLLEGQKAHLIIKNHQYEGWSIDDLSRFERIHLFTDAELGLELHDLLGGADVLITDYSSIFVDFLLLNRPILFFVPDLHIYRNRRGFLLEPFEDWTPGVKAESSEELIHSLSKILDGEDEYGQIRDRLRKLFHTHIDDKACERTLAWLTS